MREICSQCKKACDFKADTTQKDHSGEVTEMVESTQKESWEESFDEEFIKPYETSMRYFERFAQQGQPIAEQLNS